jgi:hypothetical protein
MPMKAAARRPAEGDVTISEVNKYVAIAVRPENPGARSTHMFRISTGRDRNRRRW